jgi:hypothetical protein
MMSPLKMTMMTQCGQTVFLAAVEEKSYQKSYTYLSSIGSKKVGMLRSAHGQRIIVLVEYTPYAPHQRQWLIPCPLSWSFFSVCVMDLSQWRAVGCSHVYDRKKFVYLANSFFRSRLCTLHTFLYTSMFCGRLPSNYLRQLTYITPPASAHVTS